MASVRGPGEKPVSFKFNSRLRLSPALFLHRCYARDNVSRETGWRVVAVHVRHDRQRSITNVRTYVHKPDFSFIKNNKQSCEGVTCLLNINKEKETVG